MEIVLIVEENGKKKKDTLLEKPPHCIKSRLNTEVEMWERYRDRKQELTIQCI